MIKKVKKKLIDFLEILCIPIALLIWVVMMVIEDRKMKKWRKSEEGQKAIAKQKEDYKARTDQT